MSTVYSDQKIREILAKVNGQGKLAEQAVTALVSRDPVFLQSLVTPYLKGIIAHGIDRARKQSGLAEPAAAPQRAAPLPQVKAKPPQRAPTQPMTPSAMDGLMQAWARGFEKSGSPTAEQPKPGTVSRSHIEAIAAMAVKNNGKKT